MSLPPLILEYNGRSAEEIAQLICRLYNVHDRYESFVEAGLSFVRDALSIQRIDASMRRATGLSEEVVFSHAA